MNPVLAAAVMGGLGLIVGSFIAAVSVRLPRDEDIVVETRREREVGRVTVVAREIDERGLGWGLGEFVERGEGDASPAAVVFAPRGHAVEVAYVLDLRQSVEGGPIELGRLFDEAVEREGPVGGLDGGQGADGPRPYCGL